MPTYINPDNEIDGLKEEINDLTAKLATRQWAYPLQKDQWILSRRKHFSDAKKFSDAKVSVTFLQDVELLKKQRDFLKRRLGI